MLVVHPISKKVVPETEVDRRDLWRTESFRTAGDFDACKGWVPADNRKTKPELTVLQGGKAS